MKNTKEYANTSPKKISEEAALQRGMDEKSKKFLEAGAEVYSLAS
jgi:hypothetical protein